MRRRHYVGVSMARRVPVVRPQSQRVVVDERGAARRPGAAPGFIVVACVLACAAFYVVGFIVARMWGHA